MRGTHQLLVCDDDDNDDDDDDSTVGGTTNAKRKAVEYISRTVEEHSDPTRRILYLVVCKLHNIIMSQWPRRLRRRSSAVRLLRMCVRILPGAWMFVCCECCVLSGRGPCDGLITRPEGFCRLWRVDKTMREQAKINRSNRWATPEATIPLAN
jgi:hypothetical protein